MAQTDERGRTTRYVYDEAGRNTLVTNAIGQQTEYAYKLNGSLQSMTDAAGRVTSYQYDANGRRTGTSFADGSSVGSGYDEAGRVTSERDQAGRETQYAYDWRGKLLRVTDALNQVTTFSYDEVGNMLTQTDAEGQTTSFEYDNLGRMTRRILPLGQAASMKYDGEDNLLEITDFNGETISFTYDADGRVLSKSYPDGSSVSYTYAPDGSQDTVTDQRGTTTLSYDEMGRLESKSDPETGTLGYDYDQSGNRTSVSSPSGNVTYSYDDLNRLETVGDPATGTTRYTYDTVGNLKTVSYPNGTVATYDYDLLNRLTLLENRGANGSIISSYAYTLDAAGNRTRVEEFSGRVVDYEYDATNRLLSETITEPGKDDRILAYTYDKVGNRVTKTENGFTTTYQYDANNRLIKEDDVTYSYDDNGNLTEKEGAEEQISYAYDYDNHMVRVETNRYGATIVVEYEYDANGNRVKKIIDGTITTSYLVDENRDYAQVLEERDGDGNLLVRYVYGHDLISQTRDNITSYYHYDGLGSTRALSSSAGIVTDEYSYDAFGLLLEQTGTTDNAYRYRGEQFDEELGFYYLRARYMDPNVGRFVTMDAFAGLSQDPVTLHKYLYANANPVSYLDPSGYSGFFDTQIGMAVQGVLSRMPCLVFTAARNALMGGIFGAVMNAHDAWFGGERDGEKILETTIQGFKAGTKFGILVTIPYLRPIIIALGLKSTLDGISDSIKQKKYAQAAFRGVVLYHQIRMLKFWNSKACFTKETLVYTKNGPEQIKNIKIGDEVYSKDVETGNQGFQRVTQVFIRDTKTLVHVSINGSNINTTPEHPFWLPGKGWVSAGDLKPGDILSFSSGENGKIASIKHETLTRPIKVYNLKVEKWHTYYVSEQNVLVHNADYDVQTRVGRWMSKEEHSRMVSEGKVQMSDGNMTHVTYPSNPEAFRAAEPGSVFVEFDVPASSLGRRSHSMSRKISKKP